MVLHQIHAWWQMAYFKRRAKTLCKMQKKHLMRLNARNTKKAVRENHDGNTSNHNAKLQT